ncbi:tetratricopeptide repeat protein [Hoyosella sp. G463]|uniref:Tetratricopeptide repeat protein n=1 Tax=Lolliginicoccus lacisalsi TaxID=2742202 RepID=A0A927JEA8_9ACTN|nr:tetratricopeptide repeat protein [Lolliginicoccus lacisalsi]
MTGPGRQTPAASFAGAVDLSALKERAARRSAPQPSAPAASRSASDSPAAASSGVPVIVDVTEATFEAEVVERSHQVLVVVDLWAPWCEPCKQLSPALEKLAREGNGSWILAKVDVEENPRIAQVFGVESIPTVVAIAGGQPVHAFSGAQSEDQIRNWLAELKKAIGDKLPGLPAEGEAAPAEPPADPRFEAAEEALNEGDFDKAEAEYQKILVEEPRNAEAKSGLNHARFLARVRSIDPEAPRKAEADPSDIEAQLAAADLEIISQQPGKAFQRLIDVVRATAGDDRAVARERLLSLLEMFDPADPTVLAARRDLAAALF